MSVYFVTAREIGRVKIGFSDEPRSRFVKMRTDSPVALVMERVIDGGLDVERELHARFGEHRLAGEWFRLSDEIEAHMATLPDATQPPVERPESLMAELARVIGVSVPYAYQLVDGKRTLTLPVALAFYNATEKRIGKLVDATDHDIAVLSKFIEPWAKKDRKA